MNASLTQIEQVLANLYDNTYAGRPQLERLAGAVADQASDTVITVDDVTKLSEGDILEFIDTSGEQVLVWDIAGQNVTVVREQNGTTHAAHNDNVFVRINPKWTLYQADRALVEAVADMHAQQLFTVGDADITLVDGQETYEVAADVHPGEGILSAYYVNPDSGSFVGLPFLEYYDPEAGKYHVRLPDWGNQGVGDVVKVLYAKTLSLSTLPADLEHAAVAYATGLLLAGSEGPRVHDPGRHTDRTVQPGQGIRDGGFWLATYQRMVWRYRAALNDSLRKLPGTRMRRVKRFRRG